MVEWTPGPARGPGGPGRPACCLVRGGGAGLIRVLFGPEPRPAWSWRSRPERRAAYGALALATLALCVVNAGEIHGVASMHGLLPPTARVPAGQLPPSLGQRLLAVAVVAPLPLAVRYPMLAWRIGGPALLLTPPVPRALWGGLPLGPPPPLAPLRGLLLG